MISVFPNSLRFCRGHSAAYGVLRKVFAGFLSFISFICAAFAQTYSDYYFIPTSGNNNKLNDVGNYNVGSISGEPAASLPDFNANVFITADSDGYTANSNYADFNARDVVFKVGDSGTGSNGAWFLLTENNTATIRGDFLFSARSAANWVQAESGVKVLSGANFQVLGDFIVENRQHRRHEQRRVQIRFQTPFRRPHERERLHRWESALSRRRTGDELAYRAH